MNKKNISLILIGILLLVLQFYVRVGNATIDVFSDVIGFILIVIGILPLAPRNVLFKKARQEWKPLNSLKIFLCSGTRD